MRKILRLFKIRFRPNMFLKRILKFQDLSHLGAYLTDPTLWLPADRSVTWVLSSTRVHSINRLLSYSARALVADDTLAPIVCPVNVIVCRRPRTRQINWKLILEVPDLSLLRPFSRNLGPTLIFLPADDRHARFNYLPSELVRCTQGC